MFCYADDLLITSTTVSGLQSLIDMCDSYICQHGIYIIREEGSIFAPQRIPFCMALGDASCTVGKVRVSTVFMCVCSTFRPSDFLLFVKNGFVVGVRCQGNSESLKECEYPHCASATRRLALDNRTYSAQLANSTRVHTM